MSRVIVKGLPAYYTEDKIRSHFAKNGQFDITDVKLMRKRSGESRRFGFIGFKSDADASDAVRYFHNSFIDTAKVQMEIAKSFGDSSVPLSMKQRQKRQRDALDKREQLLLEQDQHQKKQKPQSISDKIEANPKLREYMSAVTEKRSWMDNAVVDGQGPDVQPDEMVQVEEGESDDEYEDFKKNNDDDDDEEMMALPKQTADDDDEEMMPMSVDDDGLAKDDNVTDLDWLKSRRQRMTEAGEKVVAEKEVQNEEKQAKKPVEKQASATPEDTIRTTGRLFIRNILYTASEDDFRSLFAPFGSLEEVHIAVDTRTGKSKGFVYIQFHNPEDAISSYHQLDKTIFQGRLLHILPAASKKSHQLDEFDLKNMPLKKQRELKRKHQASKSQFQWNSLYMSQDAVLESVAAKMGVSKSELIDPTNASSAVKQALAEADVIGDVRRYFESHGVDLLQFEQAKEKDDRIILVKNFAHGTTSSEIGELFAPYGAVQRILMPPHAATIAIVEFRDVPSARSAFSKLSYRRFKSGILYLEKGPKGLFTRDATSGEQAEAGELAKLPVVEVKATVEEAVGEEEDDTPVGPTVSVFVKNLNFSTTQTDLTKLFADLPGFVIAVVKTKPNPKHEGQVLSMGYGFAEFSSKDAAETAISTLDGYVLDGHRIQLKLSHRPGSTGPDAPKKKGTNKIIIKNLPFEATRKDVVELLGAFGQIKSARVPRKFDKSARGFAFVEFNLAKEAEAAMDQLKGVHLLGRRLVMQFAEGDANNVEEEIEKMMAKAQKQTGTRMLAEARNMGKGKQEGLEDDDADESGLGADI